MDFRRVVACACAFLCATTHLVHSAPNDRIGSSDIQYLSGMAQSRMLTPPKSHGGYFALAWSPDEKLIAGGTGAITVTQNGQKTHSGGEVLLWDAASGALRRTLPSNGQTVQWVAFSVDGNRLVSASWDHTRKTGIVRCWDPRAGRLMKELPFDFAPYDKPLLSPDGKTFVAIEMRTVEQKRVTIDRATGQKRESLATVPAPGNVVVFDLESGETRWSKAGIDPRNPGLAISSRSHILAWVSEPTPENNGLRRLQFLRLDSGAVVRDYPAPDRDLWAARMIFFQNDEALACVGKRQLRVWDTQSGEQRPGLTELCGNEIALARDGQSLYVVGDLRDRVELWDLIASESRGTYVTPVSKQLSEAAIAPVSGRIAAVVGSSPGILELERSKIKPVVEGGSKLKSREERRVENLTRSPNTVTKPSHKAAGPTIRRTDLPTKESPAAPAKPAARVIDTLEAAHEAMEIVGVQIQNSGAPRTGDAVTIVYELKNGSDARLQLPGASGKGAKPLLGSLQHWIEREGGETLIPAIGPRIGRRGASYAAGGATVDVPAIVEPGQSIPFKRTLKTTGYPPGSYRYIIEFRKPGVTTSRSVSVRFELLE